jgi:alkanesulfonate monooxygenase SsuD/methylene tetrahydromethanopterin reductase-like flavin-dependent oxidoreductase (luciferase family)
MKSASAQSRPDEYAKGGDMKMTIAGTPDTIAAKVRQLEEMGVNHLHLRFLGEIDGETAHIAKTSAELFAKEVLPRFVDAPPSRQPALVAAL